MNLSRRRFLGASAAGAGLLLGRRLIAQSPATVTPGRAQVAIFVDLEMARNFPRWEDQNWDYEKGNLDAGAKRWIVEAGRRVKAAGGVINGFVVGQVLEQENVDWLKEMTQAGHPLGNHTYDHVSLSAAAPGTLQKRFERAPWLIEGKTVPEVLRENIRLCNAALKTRIGVVPKGFRTPDDFTIGLRDRPDLQKLLLDEGFEWVQCVYPAHPFGEAGKEPTPEVLDGIVKAIPTVQPFVYESGLVEIPMSPPSDIIAFRHGKWTLETYLKSIRLGLDRAIADGGVYVHLFHLGCIAAMDPEFRAVDLICRTVKEAGEKAALVAGDEIARRAKASAGLR